MAAQRVKLTVSKRTLLGSPESRRLRKQGLIPGVIYGHSEPIAIAVGERELRAALTTSAGSHAVLDVAIDGGSGHSAILKDYQRDKVRGTITHIDLQEVRLDVAIQTAVSINLVGEAAGVKLGGVLAQVTNEVNVEALPLEVPQHLDVDVSELGLGESIKAGDLKLPSGVTLLDDPDETVIATITHQRLDEEPETTEGGEGASSAAAGSSDDAADGADDSDS